MARVLEAEAKISFRDQLRAARAHALRDAEAFGGLLFCIERLLCKLSGRTTTLGDHEAKPLISELAIRSPLASDIPSQWPELHMAFADTYEVVRIARNDALHQGAFARHLTTNALNLAITLEDALMNGSKTVGAYMVRNVECAFPWQPISFIRQIMLNSSFSYLPVCLHEEEQPVWHLVSDYSVARFLRSTSDRKSLLAMTLDEATKSNPDPLQLEAATPCEFDTPVEKALHLSKGQPILVQRRGDPGELIGILTSFDLL